MQTMKFCNSKKTTYLVGLYIFLVAACSKGKVTVSWEEHDSQTDYTLAAVHFKNQAEGYAVGGDSWYYGVLTHTVDGGTTWQADSLTDGFLWGLQADTVGHLYTAGVHSNLLDLHPNSSGWSYHRLPFWEIIRDVAFWDSGTGIMVGGSAFHNGYIATLKNGFQLDSLQKIDYALNQVCYSEENVAHAVGYGVVLRSIDNGVTWQQADIQGDNFRSVCFPTPKIGYVVGAVGMILKTIDGGDSWQILRDGDAVTVKDIPFRSVFFENANKGYIVGDKGTFWTTRDGGDSWQIIDDFPKINLYDVFVVDNKGWIVGEGGAIFSFEK